MEKSKQFKVTFCAIVRNEARYLLEWIAYHSLIGVEHFFIYDHESNDGTGSILKALESLGIVTYVFWEDRQDRSPQISAYEDASQRFKDRTVWVGFMDPDEFLVLHRHDNISALVDAYQNYSGVCVNWRVFGSSGQQTKEDRLMMERFTKASLQDFVPNRLVKTFVKIDTILNCLTHVCSTSGPGLFDTMGNKVAPVERGHLSHCLWETAQINHYFCKSKEEFMIKYQRGDAGLPLTNPNRNPKGLSYFESHDRNEVEDTTILKFLPAVKLKVKELENAIAACATKA